MKNQRYISGAKLFDAVHGNGSAQETVKKLQDVSPELAKYSIEWIFADLYSDDTLNFKTRELVNLAALVAIGAEPQIRNHVYAALNVGCSEKEIKAVMLQMLIIVGFPKVVNAIFICDEVIKLKQQEKVQ